MTALATVLVVSCGGDSTSPGDQQIKVGSIVIDGGSLELERGSISTVTAKVRDTAGNLITVPLAWRSSADSIVRFGRDGQLIAGDTGVVGIAASALGVVSAPVGVHVVWRGAATAAPFHFAPPLAVSPGATLGDSIRLAVTTLDGTPAAGARVSFAVTAGGGTVSPASPTLVTVGASGTAAAKWVLGATPGTNSVTATVVGGDSLLINWVKGNPIVFTVTSFAALAAVQGDGQTGGILAALPIAPSIKLVDSAGTPRAGIPVTFTATSNGRVANTVASTSVGGVASPGTWTLGDATGDQQLIVTVEAAKLVLHATATGSSVRLSALHVATSQGATCAITGDTFVSCLGQPPLIGTGDTTKTQSTPTITKGGIQFGSIVGGSTHFCGTGAADLSIYCWGVNALVDTTNGLGAGGATVATYQPTRLQSNIAWVQVTPGGQHNCALANDHTAYCWGSDTTGQLGDNLITRHLAPQHVAGGFKFSTLAAGASHECGIDLSAAAFCWGLNSSAQIGDGTTTTRLAPTAVLGSHQWTAIGAGAAWTCGLADGGAAMCWGGATGRTTPAPYAGAVNFTQLSVGSAHACALTSQGVAYCWGDNSSGQLGDSTTTSRDLPKLVTTTIRFAAISAGAEQTCGLSTDGFVACWGRNQFGELGFDTPSIQLTPRFIVLGVKP
jgi:alpha-tubulin suppressor-like RCC1 family protein